MIIYPAIDIRERKCVRLVQGKADQQTVYSENPVEVARQWAAKGAQALHVVDLDRAIVGASDNTEVIREIVEAVPIPVQVGGGLRSLNAVEKMLAMGCARVILGTKAYQDRRFLREVLQKFGEKIVVAVDTRDGKLAVLGWTVKTEKPTEDFVREIEQAGVNAIVYTDIARDGMLVGPDVVHLKQILSKTKMAVIYSGGIGNKEHIDQLKALEGKGLAGIIVGKALYEGAVQLEEVV